MALKDRQKIIREIEKLRGGRRLVCISNFDRGANGVPGVSMLFDEDIKEPLFRVLKETLKEKDGIDVYLYTRGGDPNAVWPIANILREFDEDFEILVPFRAHSAGTMFALSAKKIVMGPIGELSTIDPSTKNPYNPRDPVKKEQALPIGVEDVIAYREFWKSILEFEKDKTLSKEQKVELMQPYLARLSTEIHPLALGIIHRLYSQIHTLAAMLLQFNYSEKEIPPIIEKLSKHYNTHHHMINRREATEILGKGHIEIADSGLSLALDKLLCQYQDDFELRHDFYLGRFMGDEVEKEGRFIAGAIESEKWGYLYESKVKIRQFLNPPDKIQIQVAAGHQVPLVPGLPRRVEIELIEQGWVRNQSPKGITV